jgi:hypothetical protein
MMRYEKILVMKNLIVENYGKNFSNGRFKAVAKWKNFNEYILKLTIV